MALLDSEIWRLKYELGYHVLEIGGEPYVGFTAFFDQVLQPFTNAGATTTSSTAVTASTTAAPATLTLASATGFASGARVVIDVDDRQETATVQSLSGSDITVLLNNAHTGVFPVSVEGGEMIIREILTKIRDVKNEMGATFGEGSLKKVDEISFYQAGSTTFGLLGSQLRYWREELSAAVGIESMWARRNASAQRMSVY